MVSRFRFRSRFGGGGGGAFPPLAPYTGPIANRLWIPTNKSAHVYVNAKNWHIAREDIGLATFIVPNWYSNSAAAWAEAGTGADATVSFSIGNVADNTFLQVALNQVIVDNTQSTFTLDASSLGILSGQKFSTALWGNFPGGVPYSPLIDKANGDRFETAATILADKTLVPNTIGTAQNGAMTFPALIAGSTTKRTAFFCGDSRMNYSDDVFDATGDVGAIGRAMGLAGLAYVNGGVPGRSLNNFNVSNTKQLALAAFCTNAIVWQLRNSISAGRNQTQMRTDLQAAAALFPTKRRIVGTESNRTNSTRSVASLTSIATVALATVASTADLSNGQSIIISGAAPAAYNGTYAITVVDGTTFSYVFAGGTSPATGTILYSNRYVNAAGQSNFNGTGTTNCGLINGDIRTGFFATDYHAWWELALPVMDAVDPNLWFYNGTPDYSTDDGVHPMAGAGGITRQMNGVVIGDLR